MERTGKLKINKIMKKENVVTEIEEEIMKVKTELVMKGYHSGWAITAYKKKLVELEDRLEKINKIIKDKK